MNAFLISPDEWKKSLPGYKPRSAEKFHKLSVKLADAEFHRLLHHHPHKEVILLSGGSASGKTEFASEYLQDFDGIIFDGTLSSIEGAKIKIRAILKACKIPLIYAIFPDFFAKAYSGFLKRDRQFSSAHFFRTHAGARSTLLWISENYPSIEIRFLKSTFRPGKKMIFRETHFPSQLAKIDFFRRNLYSELQIIGLV